MFEKWPKTIQRLKSKSKILNSILISFLNSKAKDKNCTTLHNRIKIERLQNDLAFYFTFNGFFSLFFLKSAVLQDPLMIQ